MADGVSGGGAPIVDGHGDQVTLKELINTLFKSSNDRMDAYWLAHNTEHQRLADQLQRDSENLSYRLEGMNQLREQVNQERGQFATRDLMDSRLAGMQSTIEARAIANSSKTDDVDRRLTEGEKARANLDGRFTMLGFSLFGASIILNLLISIATAMIVRR